MSQPNWMTPLLSYWGMSGTEEPLSGDVSQWFRIFSPTVNVNGSGEPVLEGAIVRDVATYGAQLSPLIQIVLALSTGAIPPADAVTELQRIQRQIEKKKEEYRQGAADRARRALEDLEKIDPPALTALVGQFGATTGNSGQLPGQRSPSA